MSARTIRVVRVYDAAEQAAGDQVLVDRIWPRGVSKEALADAAWIKEVAPSSELRRWYGHDPEKFAEFTRRYRAELDTEDGQEALRKVAEHGSAHTLTLLTATKDVEHSNATVLAELLRKRS